MGKQLISASKSGVFLQLFANIRTKCHLNKSLVKNKAKKKKIPQ